MDTSNMKTSPGSPEPRDNTNFSIILEAPQVFFILLVQLKFIETGNNILQSKNKIFFR